MTRVVAGHRGGRAIADAVRLDLDAAVLGMAGLQ